MRWHLVVPAAFSTLLFSFTQLHSADAPNKIKPVMILSGSDSGVSKPLTELCRSDKELRAVWDKHQDGDDRHHCPDMNFDSFMVIAMFLGTVEGKASIWVFEIVEDADAIHVRIFAGGPQTGVTEEEESEADRLKRITRSYAFVVLPTSKKKVIVEEDELRSLVDPHKWKESKLFPVLDKE